MRVFWGGEKRFDKNEGGEKIKRDGGGVGLFLNIGV